MFQQTSNTGVASYNIRRNTLHRLLNMRPGNKSGFSAAYVEKLKRKLSGVKFFIIEEISMVPPDMLYTLREVLYKVHPQSAHLPSAG